MTHTPPMRLPAAQPPDTSTTDVIWTRLEEVRARLRLPPAVADAAMDELESHVLDQLRDLSIRGIEPAEITAQILTSLGDPALLARSIRQAQSPFRRFSMMHAAIIALCAAGAGIGLSAYRAEPAPQAAAQCAPSAVETDGTRLAAALGVPADQVVFINPETIPDNLIMLDAALLSDPAMLTALGQDSPILLLDALPLIDEDHILPSLPCDNGEPVWLIDLPLIRSVAI